MNRKISLILVSLLTLSTLEYASAEMLAPPSLGSLLTPTLTPPPLTEVIEVNTEQNRKVRLQELREQRMSPAFRKKITYELVASGSAITLEKAREEQLYKETIHLDAGANIGNILAGSGFDPIEAGGEPLFSKLTLTEMRDSLREEPFSIINGQFFDPYIVSTRLSFGLKADGILRTTGADNGSSEKNILIVSSGSAQIVPYTGWEQLRDAEGDTAIVGLSLRSAYYRHENIGRTYLCVQDPDEAGRSSTLLIFIAESMSEYNVENEMFRNGCTRESSIKMDASGSTRLWYAGNYVFGVSRSGKPDKRRVPHGIVISDTPTK